MANNKKITALPALGATPATDDVLPIVDVSGTATTKKVTVANLVAAAPQGDLLASNNLSDVANAGTSRTNLGLGTAATTASTDYASAFFNIVTKTANYTLTNAENGKVIFCNSSSRIDITVPSGLTSGFNCRVVQGGTGRVRFLTSGTTINGYTSGSNTPNAVIGQNGVVDLVPVASNTYTLAGDIDYLFVYGNTKSLSLDGVDDWIDVGNITALNSTTNYSISFWLKDTSTTTSSMYLFNSHQASSGTYIEMYSSNVFQFRASNAQTARNTTRVTKNAWHCIVVTFGSSTTKIYQDGVLKLSSAESNATTHASTGNTFRIGARLTNTSDVVGFMDEFAIYSEALTDGGVSVGATAGGQVEDIYKGQASGGSGGTIGTPGDLTSFQGSGNGGLAHWWRFEDSPNDVIGSNNGTLNGTTYSTDTP